MSWMTAERSGSDGNGSGRVRTKCSRIASLSQPSSRSSATWAPPMGRADPESRVAGRPHHPARHRRTEAHEKRLKVPIAPPRRCVKRTPSSCGKTVKKC